MARLEQVAGAAVMALFLADIFMTVLHGARRHRAAGAALEPDGVGGARRRLAAVLGRRRGAVLSYGGPLIVILLILFWALGLVVGAALIVQPELGTAITPSSGDTPKDFVTALPSWATASRLSAAAAIRRTPAARGSSICSNSLIGGAVLLAGAELPRPGLFRLRERNTLALTVELMTGGTGDAAEMLARLAPEGDFSDATSELGNLVRPLAQTKEGHHFYPLFFSSASTSRSTRCRASVSSSST